MQTKFIAAVCTEPAGLLGLKWLLQKWAPGLRNFGVIKHQLNPDKTESGCHQFLTELGHIGLHVICLWYSSVNLQICCHLLKIHCKAIAIYITLNGNSPSDTTSSRSCWHKRFAGSLAFTKENNQNVTSWLRVESVPVLQTDKLPPLQQNDSDSLQWVGSLSAFINWMASLC